MRLTMEPEKCRLAPTARLVAPLRKASACDDSAIGKSSVENGHHVAGADPWTDKSPRLQARFLFCHVALTRPGARHELSDAVAGRFPGV